MRTLCYAHAIEHETGVSILNRMIRPIFRHFLDNFKRDRQTNCLTANIRKKKITVGYFARVRTIGAAWRDLLQRWWWFRAFATVRCVVADCGRRVQLVLLRASSIIAFHAIKSIGCGSKIIVPTNTRTGQIQLSMRSVFAPRRHSVKNDHAEFRLESGTSIEQPPQTPMTYKLPYEMERLYSATECERFLNADGWIIHRFGYTTRPVMII